MKKNRTKQERRAINEKAMKYEAKRIADSVVRAAAMTEPMRKEEEAEMWDREYAFALERLSKKKK